MLPLLIGAVAFLKLAKHKRRPRKTSNPHTAPVMTYRAAHAWESQAAERKVSVVARSDRGFMRAYQRAGSWSKLSPWWQRRRNNFVARHLAQAGINGEHLWEQVHGQRRPTRRGLALIMWAMMPPGKR